MLIICKHSIHILRILQAHILMSSRQGLFKDINIHYSISWPASWDRFLKLTPLYILTHTYNMDSCLPLKLIEKWYFMSTYTDSTSAVKHDMKAQFIQNCTNWVSMIISVFFSPQNMFFKGSTGLISLELHFQMLTLHYFVPFTHVIHILKLCESNFLRTRTY